jgi:20S proteasome alpha/beta subunit
MIPWSSFLGFVDLYGSNYTDDHLATGYGAHLATPLLRKHWKPNMTRKTPYLTSFTSIIIESL